MAHHVRWWIALILCLAFPAGLALAEPVPASPVPKSMADRLHLGPAPRGGASAAALLDWRTGELLYARNADQRRYPASTTKVLTALIALERGKLDDQITISRRAANTPGSTMYLKAGEVHSLYDLLHGLLLRSGNDAAAAIAEHIGGSVEGFAELMNERAHRLGATNSHFVNPHGLTHPQHYSTAYDLALITRAALQQPTFAAIVAQPVKELTYEAQNRQVVLYNTNRLLSILPGADGVKTGTTAAAGACLVASATRDEQKLIAVVLHAGNRWRESAELLEWGFKSFRLVVLAQAGEIVTQVPVRGGKLTHVPAAVKGELSLVIARQGGQVPEFGFERRRQVAAPVEKGDLVGYAGITTPDGQQERVELVAAESVPKASLLDRIYRLLLSLTRAADDLGIDLSGE